MRWNLSEKWHFYAAFTHERVSEYHFFPKTHILFMEFKWGKWFRSNCILKNLDAYPPRIKCACGLKFFQVVLPVAASFWIWQSNTLFTILYNELLYIVGFHDFQNLYYLVFHLYRDKLYLKRSDTRILCLSEKIC